MNWINFINFLLWIHFKTCRTDLIRMPYKTAENRNFEAVLNLESTTYVASNNHLVAIDRLQKNLTEIDIPADSQLLRICRAGVQNTGSDSICTNSMKVIEKFNSTHLIACGTNVLTPRCYYVDIKTHNFSELPLRVNNYVPDNPGTTVATAFTRVDSNPQMYSAFCQDSRTCSFSRFLNTSTDLVVAESRLSFGSPTFLNTYFSERKDKHEHAYLFYRDALNIFENDGFTRNGKNNEYGMVARVCHSDSGGSLQFAGNFMTFMRARLLCPVREQTGSNRPNTLYYDNLKSTYKVGNVVYGLFTLPSFWPHEGTAICAFDLDTIDSFIEGTVFPDNQTQYYDPRSETLSGAYPPDDNVRFLPGRCPGPGQTTRQVDAIYLNFVRSVRTLIAKPVTPIGGQPVEIVNGNYDFLIASETDDYHILYLLKENGFMKKLRVRPSTTEFPKPSPLLENQVLNDDLTILSASLANEDIMLVTRNEIFQVKRSLCGSYKTCSACEIDPHCSWIVQNNRHLCVSGNATSDENSCSAVPAAPQNLNIAGEYPNITIEWIRNDSIPITGYQLELQKSYYEEPPTYQITTSTSYQIPKNMTSRGTDYVATVYAINDQTLSDPAVFNFRIDLQAPALHVDLSSMAFQWNVTEGAAFFNLSVYDSFTNEQVQSFLMMANPADSEQAFPISGLESENSYMARIFAISESNIESDIALERFNITLPTTPAPSTAAPTTSQPAHTTPQPITTTITQPITTTTSFIPASISPNNSLQTTQTTTSTDLTTQFGMEESSASPISSPNPSTVEQTEQNDVITTRSTQAANKRQPVLISEGATWSLVLILLIIFMASTVVLLLVLVQNRCKIGPTTKEIKTGDEDKVLKRKLYLFWWSEKGYHPGQSEV